MIRFECSICFKQRICFEVKFIVWSRKHIEEALKVIVDDPSNISLLAADWAEKLGKKGLITIFQINFLDTL